MDKCDSHDECFRLLYNKWDGIDEKLDRIAEGLRDRLHDGDVRFVQLEMRLAQCEKSLASSTSGRIDVKRKLVGSIIDVGKTGVIALIGAAVWAFMNGYVK